MTAYNPLHRLLHWLTALLILCMAPVGFFMADRGRANIWDDLTNQLYNWHKLIGFVVLLLVVTRFVSRAINRAPAYPADMPRVMLGAAHASHGLMYGLLLIIPLLGWAGVTAYPATVTVGGYHLPSMPLVQQDPALAKQLFWLHGTAALALLALVGVHIAAALFHLIIKRDGVFQRMWPRRS